VLRLLDLCACVQMYNAAVHVHMCESIVLRAAVLGFSDTGMVLNTTILQSLHVCYMQ